MPRTRLVKTLLALTLFAASGCRSIGKDPGDPLKPLNRAVFVFNGVIDQVIFLPLSFFYRTLLPPQARGAVSNVLGNLAYLDTAVNSLLQGKGKQGKEDFTRFFVNSTVGIGGIFDVAKRMDLPAHKEDFGQTLATWGVGSGPYLVLPLWGPTTLRGAAGLPVTVATNPLFYADDTAVIAAGITMYLVDRRLRIDPKFVSRIEEADDPYVFLRDAYLQNRNFLIHDGSPPTEEYEEELDGLLDELDELDGLDEDAGAFDDLGEFDE